MAKFNLLDLAHRVLQKALDKETTWHKTSRRDEFKLEFHTGFITVDSWYEDNIHHVDIALYNDDGEFLDRITETEGDSKEYQMLKSLHDEARKIYYKADETFESIFYQLSKAGRIGSDKPKKSIKGDDELPF